MGKRLLPLLLGYSMLTYCPHSEAEMTVAGTLSPFDRVQVTVMPAGSHDRDNCKGTWFSMCNGDTFYGLENTCT